MSIENLFESETQETQEKLEKYGVLENGVVREIIGEMEQPDENLGAVETIFGDPEDPKQRKGRIITMDFSLDRFRSAHAGSYETALQEIKAGRKQSHWMWYIFPQILGLGYSTEAMYYAIQNRDEAVRYWNDPVLRSHMIEICQELLKLNDSIDWIMGYPDNLKLRSCMTLFWLVTGEYIFKDVLDRFYDGSMDEFTLQRIM